MALRESIARRAHSSVDRKVAGAGGRSAPGASRGSEVTPPPEGPPSGWSGDRRDSSVIGLCFREARRSRNGPPSLGTSGERARAPARGHERADVRVRPPVSEDGPSAPRRRAARYPSSSDGKDTTTGTSRQQRHHDPHTKAETPEPPEPNRRLDPATAPTRLPRPNPPCLASPKQSPASSHPPHPSPSDLPGPIPCRRPA
jgi:hypothetical protein